MRARCVYVVIAQYKLARNSDIFLRTVFPYFAYLNGCLQGIIKLGRILGKR